MEIKEIRNELLGEKYYKINHTSGLTIYVFPKENYSTTYAVFGTKYGSIDTVFRKPGEEKYTEIPEGIAHFLEHKLFESEELDAFQALDTLIDYVDRCDTCNLLVRQHTVSTILLTKQVVAEALIWKICLVDFYISPCRHGSEQSHRND